VPSTRTPQGGCSRGTAALFLGLLAASLHAQASKAPLARIRLFKPECSATDGADVAEAIQEASALLEHRCGLRLALVGQEPLPVASGWCHLPAGPRERAKALRSLAAAAKAAHPRELALFLLPSSADPRLSWAFIDSSLRAACDSPQEPRFLARFGCLFFTDETWMAALSRQPGSGPSRAALLVAHEVLHSLTQRGHPTGAEPGSVMADHVADLGTKIGDDWCACALQSPYLEAAP
jgi:hypothetical protein